MWKIITVKNKQKKPIDKGFITIEIIIALLIAFGFLMVSLQTLVLAMVFKVQAQEEQKADKLIQEDIERLNDLGSILTLGATGIEACDGDLDDNGIANDGYSQQLWANLLAAPADLTVSLLSTVDSSGTTEAGKTLTLTRTQVPVTTSGSPNRILGVAYEVTKPDEDGDNLPDVIANRYVEVIPDEALECP
jgi:type II secretory pathway pseudopilin PulG